MVINEKCAEGKADRERGWGGGRDGETGGGGGGVLLCFCFVFQGLKNTDAIITLLRMPSR